MRNKVAKRLHRQARQMNAEDTARRLRGEKVPARNHYRELKKSHNRVEVFVKDLTSKRQKREIPKKFAREVASVLTGKKQNK